MKECDEMLKFVQRSRDSRLELATQSSRKAKPLASPVLINLTLHIPFSLQYKYPHTHEILRASRENIEKETLEKNKIDSSKIYT